MRGRERQREALELLASVLWHLELAVSLAEFPNESMAEHRGNICDERDVVLPWKTWIDQQKGLAVTVGRERFTVEYEFQKTLDPSSLQLIQSTLIGDVAMRLDALREVLRPICHSNSPVFSSRKQLQKRLMISPVSKMNEATAIVVAFRDLYLHAEFPDKEKYGLADFRAALGDRYRLRDVCCASLMVWLELYRACRQTM